ncbi:MAG: YybH family protein [Gemmatimonadota bacterium]
MRTGLPRRAVGALILLAAGCWLERRPAASPDAAQLALYTAIEEMLAEAAEAWNRGELEGFMDGYLQSPLTTYIGSSGLVVGFDSIRARFTGFFEPGAERGHLAFEALRVRRLGAEHALATARYILRRDEGVTSSGPFTLVLRRVEGKWKIIHDQTSSDPTPEEP